MLSEASEPPSSNPHVSLSMPCLVSRKRLAQRPVVLIATSLNHLPGVVCTDGLVVWSCPWRFKYTTKRRNTQSKWISVVNTWVQIWGNRRSMSLISLSSGLLCLKELQVDGALCHLVPIPFAYTHSYNWNDRCTHRPWCYNKAITGLRECIENCLFVASTYFFLLPNSSLHRVHNDLISLHVVNMSRPPSTSMYRRPAVIVQTEHYMVTWEGVETCQSIITAGWSSRSAKLFVTQLFQTSPSSDQAETLEHIEAVKNS